MRALAGLRTFPPELFVTKRLRLRRVAAEDFRPWAALRQISRAELQPAEPAWPADALSAGRYAAQVRRARHNWRAGKGYSFHLFLRTDNQLLGNIELADIRRGCREVATLGYWLGTPFTGQGYMQEAGEAVLRFAFTTLKLNRLEATCLPENTRSLKRLHALGFTEIGRARNYLRINGIWQDHLLLEKITASSETAR